MAKLKPNNFRSRCIKGVTFAVDFLLTAALVIAGVAVYPEVLGKAATANNDFVFELFLDPFLVVLFLLGREKKKRVGFGEKKNNA